jgi:Yip1 domain
MDFEKLVQLSQDQLSDYLDCFVATLRNPQLRFSPLVPTPPQQGIVFDLADHDEDRTASRINPRLFTFVLISIFLGFTIGLFVPGRKEAPDIVEVIIVIVILWVTISWLLHLLSKLFRGKATFVETISVSLQIFSVVFVLSSVLTLVWGVLIRNAPVDGNQVFSLFNSYPDIARFPFFAYFLVQFVLLSIYLPNGLGRIHRFVRWRRTVFSIVLPITLIGFAIFNICFYKSTGVNLSLPIDEIGGRPDTYLFPRQLTYPQEILVQTYNEGLAVMAIMGVRLSRA